MSEKKRKHPDRGNKWLRFFDRYAGIPVIFILGLLKRKIKIIPSTIDNIAILKVSGIGDTVILSGIVQDLRRQYPDSKITIFVSKNNYAIAKLVPCIDNVELLSIKKIWHSIKKIRSKGIFDVWLDFGPWARFNALMSAFAKARLKIGYYAKGQYRHFVFDIISEYTSDVHEIENYRKLIKHIGVVGSLLPKINIDEVKDKSDFVILHLLPGGSRSYLKEWPEEHWLTLIDWLNERNISVKLTGSKFDVPVLTKIKIKSKKSALVDVIAGISLLETGQMIKNAKLVVSVDTGIMHMTSAIGTPLIALHGPTASFRWGPLSSTSKVIQTEKKCSPCISFGFEKGCGENECMQSIKPESVINVARNIMKNSE